MNFYDTHKANELWDRIIKIDAAIKSIKKDEYRLNKLEFISESFSGRYGMSFTVTVGDENQEELINFFLSWG